MLQILPYDTRNDPHSHSLFLVNLCHGKAHIVLFPRCPIIIAGMGHCIDAVRQADIYHSLMHVRHLSGILALDTTFFRFSWCMSWVTLLTSTLTPISSKPARSKCAPAPVCPQRNAQEHACHLRCHRERHKEKVLVLLAWAVVIQHCVVLILTFHASFVVL